MFSNVYRPILNVVFQSTGATFVYPLDPMLSNDSTPHKLADGTVTSNLTKIYCHRFPP